MIKERSEGSLSQGNKDRPHAKESSELTEKSTDALQDSMVSCRFLGWVFDLCREKDISVNDVLDGVDYPEQHFYGRNNYVDWQSFCILVENASQFFSDEELVQYGKLSFKHPLFRVYALLGRLLFNVKTLYRWLVLEIVPRLYSITCTVISHSRNQLHVRMTVNEPLINCPKLFIVFEGQYRGLAAEIGYEECDVEATYSDRGAEFVFNFQERRTVLGSFLTFLRKPWDFYLSTIQLKNAEVDLLNKGRELDAETQRIREAQSRISGLEGQYQILEKTLLDMIWVSDLNDGFVYVSPAIESMFGYDVEEALGLNFFDLISGHEVEGVISNLRQDLEKFRKKGNTATKNEFSRVFEVLALRKDGSEFWCEVHRAFQYDDKGDLQGIAGVTRDISRRKQSEIEKALLERELSHSRHMESIGQLAGGIAHDFNNMLTTVLGFADLAHDGIGEDHPIAAYLTEISRAGTRASDLVKQLLTFSKQEPMEPVPLSVNDLIDQLNPMLKRLVAENVELTIDTQEVPTILGDPSELERVLINLCINATDAMQNGGRLYISTREYLLSSDDSRVIKAGTDSFACISVSDTGHGIEPEIQQRVLEPFFTTKPFGQGTGLGLAVTYSIVQQHNGFLDLVSHPNHGTTIKVFLPASHLNVVDHEVDPRILEKDHTGTVLVVEDQEQVRRLMVQILETAGYDVMEAQDGLEAVTTYERYAEDIDLILMDIVMPKMGGRDAMILIREVDQDAQVLFMTGYSGQDPKIDFALNVDYKVLRKPFNTGDVIRRVSEIIEAQPAKTSPSQ